MLRVVDIKLFRRNLTARYLAVKMRLTSSVAPFTRSYQPHTSVQPVRNLNATYTQRKREKEPEPKRSVQVLFLSFAGNHRSCDPHHNTAGKLHSFSYTLKSCVPFVHNGNTSLQEEVAAVAEQCHCARPVAKAASAEVAGRLQPPDESPAQPLPL
ncbi:hypothetical protein Taro_042865 [Colocasia esculenta]|uniref:Uncharacterized protein n=1 Tax=Colocasia esculenta TaxID=4460 RepID=A0A843WPX9_COLES|nr:hypothetical protein [Colocasia esculenta]